MRDMNYSILRLIGSHWDQAILTRLSEIEVLARLTGGSIKRSILYFKVQKNEILTNLIYF